MTVPGKHKTRILPILAVLSLMASLLAQMSCRHEAPQPTVRSAYYWSTTWESDSAQADFLRRNDIKRIYLRYFDVVVDGSGKVMPNATVRFASAMPDSVEIVPTVFIVNNCLGRDVEKLDSLILRRVLQISETHDVVGVKEIQIDCDWSGSTRDTYFAMLSRLSAAAHKKGLKVSATIRLHQLADKVPPVDRGVLMMYNTGDLKDPKSNPILDMKDASPYLQHLEKYSLELATAYPVFAWRVLYRNNHLVGIMHSDDDLPVLTGDTIMTKEAPLKTVLEAKSAISRLNPSANHEVILFDISQQNINRIKQYDYEKVYSH